MKVYAKVGQSKQNCVFFFKAIAVAHSKIAFVHQEIVIPMMTVRVS